MKEIAMMNIEGFGWIWSKGNGFGVKGMDLEARE